MNHTRKERKSSGKRGSIGKCQRAGLDCVGVSRGKQATTSLYLEKTGIYIVDFWFRG